MLRDSWVGLTSVVLLFAIGAKEEQTQLLDKLNKIITENVRLECSKRLKHALRLNNPRLVERYLKSMLFCPTWTNLTKFRLLLNHIRSKHCSTPRRTFINPQTLCCGESEPFVRECEHPGFPRVERSRHVLLVLPGLKSNTGQRFGLARFLSG